MKQTRDTEFEKGYNIAYYLEQYAPDILSRALQGLHGEPKDFFLGLKTGQRDGRGVVADLSQKHATEKEKQDKEHERAERDREAAYKDKLRKQEEHQKIETQIKREFDENPFEKVLLKARSEQKKEREDSERREQLKKQSRAHYNELNVDATELKSKQADTQHAEAINKKSEETLERKQNAEKVVAMEDKAQSTQTMHSDKVDTRMQEIADIRQTTQAREQEKTEGRDATKNR